MSSIIKTKSINNSFHICVLNQQNLTIDLNDCIQIDFLGFSKKDTLFLIHDNKIVLYLTDGSEVNFENINVYLNEIKTTANIIFMNGVEKSYLINNCLELTSFMFKYFTYKNSINDVLTTIYNTSQQRLHNHHLV